MNSIRQSKFLVFTKLRAFGIGLLLVSATSLICSYILSNSEPWQREYLENGWIIEFIRSVIVVLFCLYLMGVVFLREFLLVLFMFKNSLFPKPKNSQVPKRESRLRCPRWVSLLIICILASGVLYLLIYHLIIAPERLRLKYEAPGMIVNYTSNIRMYLLPYVFYFPYSFINFICLGIPVFSVLIYAGKRDFMKISKIERNFLNKLENIQEEIKQNIHGKSPDDVKNIYKIKNNDIKWYFEHFCLRLINIIGRYTALVISMATLITFEYRFGSQTLAEEAQIWTFGGYFLVTFIVVIICLVYFKYEKAFQKTVNSLYNINRMFDYDTINYSIFLKNNNFTSFLIRILNRYISLYVTIIILTFIPPINSFIANIIKFISGSS